MLFKACFKFYEAGGIISENDCVYAISLNMSCNRYMNMHAQAC